MRRNEYYLQIVAAFLSNPSTDEVAKVLHIPKGKLNKITSDPEFKKLYLEKQNEILEHTTGYLVNNIGKMSNLLVKIAEDERTPQQIKLNAIRTVFEYSLKYTEVNNVLRRIKNLEAECGIDE